jgi:SAM-dependent methyltransferase
MQLFSYIRYFFYLAFNWNFRIAWYMIRFEIKGEKKYGINTTGADELKKLEKKSIDIEHATIYMPVNYSILEDLFQQLSNKTINHFIDIGCGKGRALCVAAHYGCTKVTGIDFSKELCEDAAANLSKTKQKIPALNYTVLNNDAFYYEIPTDADCIFLFNPFDAVIMSGVAENIIISYEKNPRDITILYANPLCKEELIAVGFKQIYHTQKMKYLEAVILQLNKS